MVLTGTYASATDLTLWYQQPAQEWTEALPIGNGRLGAMVYGGQEQERIPFNEDTLWNGEPGINDRPNAAKVLPEIRQLLFEGRQQEAEGLASSSFMGDPEVLDAYQIFGTLLIDCPGYGQLEDYRRELDLNFGLVTVKYRARGVDYTRQTFCSEPDQVLVWHIQASEPEQINLAIGLECPHPNTRIESISNHQITMYGQVRKGVLNFAAQLEVYTEGGQISTTNNRIRIRRADAVTVLLTGHTSYKSFEDVSADPGLLCTQTLQQASQYRYEQLLARHVLDYQDLFHRVSLNLGPNQDVNLPTDQRVAQAGQLDDPGLAALMFQYGRYLLIAGSRSGTQPLNLMGIWNDSIDPPWGGRYTTNIALQMCYWPTEVCNLSECHEPLFSLIDDCMINGRKTAKVHYNASGWVLHHNTDLWRRTAPCNNAEHGIWVTGGAWLCHHLWEHYLFTGDRSFLENQAYPAMKESCQFFLDFLIPDPRTGLLVSTPSNSPEHGGLVAGPAIDHEIISSLFAITAQAAGELKRDTAWTQHLLEVKDQITPLKIGRSGELLEWGKEVDNPDNLHHYLSHLWGIYPGASITPETLNLFQAAQTSLNLRQDVPANWPRAWKINLYARFNQDAKALSYINKILTENTYANLFTSHPPFIISGNLGLTAGIAEMLIQSHDQGIKLLPALPQRWSQGSASGLCARGGYIIDMAWENNKLSRAVILSNLGGVCYLQGLEQQIQVHSNGDSVEIIRDQRGIQFITQQGQRYELAFSP